MQGDYFAYNNQAYPGYTQYPSCTPDGVCTMPTSYQQRTVEKLKKNKSKSSMSASRNFEDYASHSTDESIHLIRSRKSRDDRYEATQILKKRSQSGTSIMKGMASQLSMPRSHSDDRSISPSLLNVEKRKGRKSSSRNKPTFSQLEEADEESFTYSDGNRLVEPSYFNNNQQLQTHYHQNQFYPQMNQYGQYQQYAQDPYAQVQQFYQQQQPQQGYQPPGAPADFYQQSNTRNFNQSGNGSQSYYQQADMYSNNGTQSFLPDQLTQGLPNGAKIVAEYFLGYLDEQQNSYQSPQPKPLQQEQGECAPQMQQYYQQPIQQQMQPQYQAAPIQQYYQQPQQQYAPVCPPGCEPGVMCPPGCEPAGMVSSDSEKEEVDIEIWEKPSKKKKNKRSQDDLRKLSDIIDALEKKLGNLNVNNMSGGNTDPIQPIFLMPKQPEQAQAKPIYVPRNIYVPVIRPVFVPRERIIVRPQIIHVARPVLVDRPVPIQQRPLVIERDRPVPVRVETIERTEAVPNANGEPCVEKAGVTETTYHEFAQPQHPHHRSSSVGDFRDSNNYDEGESQNKANKQLVLDLLAEAERRKQNLESRSNESFSQSSQRWKQIPEETHNQTAQSTMSTGGTYHPSSIPFNSGYTLEVLDQRVSDRFEKVDEETIKQRYGVDSFQYLPGAESNAGASTMRSSGGSFKSLGSMGENNESVYGQSTNGNLTSILTDLANLANK